MTTPDNDKNDRTHAERNPLARRAGPLPHPRLPRRGYADGPFGQVHFRDTGSGIPLLLCHQAPQSSKQFTRVYETLHENGVRAIGVDMPGFGESDPTPFVPSIEDWATVVPAVLDALGIDRFNVLGHHTGALVATELALTQGARVQKLILNGPLPMSEEARRESLDWVRREEIEAVPGADGGHLMKAFRFRFDTWGEGADPHTITRYVTEQFQGYAPYWIGHHAAFLYDHESALKRLELPTMILTNTGDQIYDLALATSRLRPDFALVELQGGGIDIVDQMPDEWTQAVAGFLLDG